jgi:hypothetical protein
MVKMALTATLATAVFASGAQAAPACGKRDAILAQLSERYREAPVGIGVAGNGGLIELLTAGTERPGRCSSPCPTARHASWRPDRTGSLCRRPRSAGRLSRGGPPSHESACRRYKSQPHRPSGRFR